METNKQNDQYLVDMLYEIIKNAQFDINRLKYKNFIHAIKFKNKRNRKPSTLELLKYFFKHKENIAEDKFYNVFCLSILTKLIEIENLKINKNTKAKDIKVFAHLSSNELKLADELISSLCEILNRHETSKLRFLYNHYIKELDELSKNFKLRRIEKKYLYEKIGRAHV